MLGKTVAAALAKDSDRSDLTPHALEADAIIGATIVARNSVRLDGQLFVDEVFSQIDPEVIVDWYIGNGETAATDDVICKLVGRAQAIHRGERTALNFLQTLSSTEAQSFSMLFRID